MEDLELEEGEACSFQDANTKDEYRNSVDPDVSLSYIDAKIQHVLGHFQKDFEGGVSAEKLGAKFGGYGSFLENGEGSPICDTPRSLPPSQLEDGSRNHVTPLSVPLTMKPKLAPGRSVYPSRKQTHTYDQLKQERALPPCRGVEHVDSNEREELKSAKSSDPRLLKVRIKVGSDNLSTQKKAAIYSGLGLDISPSTSVDCSPSESDGMFHDPQDVLIESPMSILQIMTCPSVHESLLLSPLQDDLILLTFNETSSAQRKDTSNADPISYCASENGSVPLRDKKTALIGKKSGPKDRNENIADVRNDNRMTSLTGPGASFKKNMEMETIDHEEVVSKALKLPSTSGSDKIVNLKKGIPNEGGSRFLGDKTLNDLEKDGTQESPLHEELRPSGMAKGYLGKLSQGKKANVDGPPRKSGIYPGTTHVDSNTRLSSGEGNRAKSSECPTVNPSEVHDGRVSYPELNNLPLASRKEKPPSKGKAKFKGSRTDETLGAVASRESMSGSSSATKSNKSFQLESSRPRSVGEDVKLKCPGKRRDKYKEFFGDLDGEGDNEDELMGVTHVGGLQELMGEKRSKVGNKKIIKLQKPSVSAPSGQSSELDNKHGVEACPIAPAAQIYMKEEVGDKYDEISAPEVPPAPAAPVFIEDWVCCDKCQKWRLLPPGKNPDDFPEKWICSMLDWLPGMNRCSVSQEETTKALMASLQAPFSDAKISEHFNFGAVVGDTNAMHQPEVKHTYVGPPLASSRGKKKPGTKEISFPNKDGTQFSETEKKQVQSAKSRSLDDVKLIPLRDVTDFEQPIMDHGLLGEKYAHESKPRENHSDGGDLRNLKPQKRRKADQDNRRTPKKLKHEDEDWISDDSKTTSRRVVEHSPSVIPSLPRKNRDLDEEAYMKMPKQEGVKRIQVSLKNIRGEGRVSVDRQSLDVGGSEGRDMTTEKRKTKDPQEAQECIEGTTELRQGSNMVLSQDNEHRKNKKPRLLKDEGKDPGITLESSKLDKIGGEHVDKLLGLGNQPSRWGINDVDSVLRKARSPMASAAASSSSKVCSSPKSKSSFREMKSSPAESVSSSPIRNSTRDKHNLVPRDPLENEAKTVSPIKCPDGTINPFWTDKQEESVAANHGSFEACLVPDPGESGFSAGAKAKGRHSVDARSRKGRKDGRERSNRDALGPSKTEDSDLCLNVGRSGDPHRASLSHSHKSGKASSSRSRDRSQSSKHEGERDKLKHISYKSIEVAPLKVPGNEEGKPEIRENVQDKDRGKCSFADLSGKHGRASQSGNEQESKNEGTDVLYGQSVACHLDNKMRECSAKPQYSKTDHSAERRPSSLPRYSTGTDKLNEAEPLVSKLPGKLGGIDPTSRNQQQRQLISNGNFVRETDAKSPIRKDSSNIAANKAIKEGADLKHMADRVKDSDSSLNRTVLYFQAALKFLHGASLLELSKNDSSKHYDMAQSVQVYGSTAKLCEYCAHEYEKSKDMASAALAYKCMEVAYLKVVYSSSSTASRDRVELQAAFKINPAGESPSSSASDLDNVNNSAAMEKSAPKGVSSPYVPGSESVLAQSRNSLIRLCNYSQDVSNAMDASRRSRVAFSAACARTGETQYSEGIACIGRALDFNFQDVQGLLRLVRLASEAIGQ